MSVLATCCAKVPATIRPPLLPAVRKLSTGARAMAPSKDKAARFVQTIDTKDLPQGFAVAATYAGIKAAISPGPAKPAPPNPKPDLALIVSARPAAAAGCFTRNAFKAAPVVVSSKLLLDGAATPAGARARSVLVNSGCANAVTGQGGMDDALRCAAKVGELLAAPPAIAQKVASGAMASRRKDDTLLLSTGVIGVPLPIKAMERALPHLASGNILRNDASSWHEVARAFMTTDTFPKLRARRFELAGRNVGIAGIDKGAGMIHPNMAGPSATLHATLLGLICTDAPVAPPDLQAALESAVARSFNCISVDGDMSTNDTILLLANGLAPPLLRPDAAPSTTTAAKAAAATTEPLPDGAEITRASHPAEYARFVAELTSFCKELAHLVVRDGEGAEKFVEIRVKNAPTYEHAHAIASSISTSALVKCAMHGQDANWGRILCATGYAPLPSGSDWRIDPLAVDVTFVPPPPRRSTSGGEEGGGGGGGRLEPLTVLRDGTPPPLDEARAKALLSLEDICVEVDLKGGSEGAAGCREECTYWTCDYSHEYISINADYRT